MLLNKSVSLFSPQAISCRRNRGLLLQFVLFELFEAYKAYCKFESWELILSPHPRHFPYDWSTVTGYLNKAQEHCLLLKESFPDYAKLVKNFEKEFCKAFDFFAKKKKAPQKQFIPLLQKVYCAFEPLLETCKENENLLFFLLKNRETIDSLMLNGHLSRFFHKIHSCDWEMLGEKMCDQYHQRGFSSQIPEFKILLTELAYA